MLKKGEMIAVISTIILNIDIIFLTKNYKSVLILQ